MKTAHHMKKEFKNSGKISNGMPQEIAMNSDLSFITNEEDQSNNIPIFSRI